MRLSVCAALLFPSVAFGSEVLIINPDSMHESLEAVLVVDTSAVDTRAAAAAGASVATPSWRISPLDEVSVSTSGASTGDLSRYDAASDDLDGTGYVSMSGVPVMMEATDVVLLAGVDLSAFEDDVIGANPTPYPHPVPIVDQAYPAPNGWRIAGLSPVNWGAGSYEVDGLLLLMDGDDVLGVGGIPTWTNDDGDVLVGEGLMIVIDEG